MTRTAKRPAKRPAPAHLQPGVKPHPHIRQPVPVLVPRRAR